MIDIYNKIYPEFKSKIYQQYYDTSKLIEQLEDINDLKFNKEYDIIIISSRLDREIKNNMFLIPILNKYPNYKKCFIGENYSKFKDIENSICTGLISHKEVYKYLAKSKLLIVPSLFESANNTIREALQCKCLILTSNNIGFYSFYPEISICTTFDENEWDNKMTNLVDNYSEIIKDYKINFDGSLTIEDIIKTVL